MAPLPHNNTALYFVDYSIGTHLHTTEVRFDGATSPATFGASFSGLLIDLLTLLNAGTVLGTRVQVSGSNVSNPVNAGIDGFTFGATAQPADDAPKFLNFVGRSPGGRRVRMAIFGYKGATSTYRLTSAESAPVSAGVARLNAATGLYFAIDGVHPIWYPYVNNGWNAYWQRAVRA